MKIRAGDTRMSQVQIQSKGLLAKAVPEREGEGLSDLGGGHLGV